jgi:sRNA-binding carbon storage regulator CsrA
MLVLTRKGQEAIFLLDKSGQKVAEFRVLKVAGNRRSIGIDAPDLIVLREELHESSSISPSQQSGPTR